MAPIRLHSSKVLDIYSALTDSELPLTYIGSGISAGFPSPADDFMEPEIDLNKELIKHPASTFYARVKGESMKDAGIGNGDLLVIDKSLDPQNGSIAICMLDGEFTVKRIKIEKGICYLMPANESFKPIKVTEDNEFLIWGIVTHVIKKF